MGIIFRARKIEIRFDYEKTIVIKFSKHAVRIKSYAIPKLTWTKNYFAFQNIFYFSVEINLINTVKIIRYNLKRMSFTTMNFLLKIKATIKFK